MIPIEKEDPEFFANTKVYERCVFCRQQTDTWHNATNSPVCSRCAETHHVSELKNRCTFCGQATNTYSPRTSSPVCGQCAETYEIGELKTHRKNSQPGFPFRLPPGEKPPKHIVLGEPVKTRNTTHYLVSLPGVATPIGQIEVSKTLFDPEVDFTAFVRLQSKAMRDVMTVLEIAAWNERMEKGNDLETTAQAYAIYCHNTTNHSYDGEDYTFHLQGVRDVVERFIHLIPEQDRPLVRAASWTHDLEDTRRTYNSVRKAVSKEVADYTYALSNEKGKNRKQRAPFSYYMQICELGYGPFVKLADRIFNVEHSKKTGSSMYSAYAEENKEFSELLYNQAFKEMFDYLGSLFSSEEAKN